MFLVDQSFSAVASIGVVQCISNSVPLLQHPSVCGDKWSPLLTERKKRPEFWIPAPSSRSCTRFQRVYEDTRFYTKSFNSVEWRPNRLPTPSWKKSGISADRKRTINYVRTSIRFSQCTFRERDVGTRGNVSSRRYLWFFFFWFQ